MAVVSATLLYLFFAALLAGLLLIPALRNAQRRRLADNLPVSKTAGVFIGLVKLKGTVETGAPPLSAYLTNCECVHHAWSVAEQWQRKVTETYQDRDGSTRTRTRTETGWTTLANGGESAPFYLQDDCGIIQIRPDGAKLELLETLNHTCGPDDPLYYGKGPEGCIAHSTHRRQFREAALPIHHPLYVIGQVRERADMVAPEIAHDKQAPMFLISTRSEEEVKSRLSWAFWGRIALGAVLAWIFLLGPLGLAVYLLVLAAGWLWMVFNSAVYLRQRVRQAWSEVSVQLKRRADLIPKLVAVVTAYCQHETSLQTELAAIRAQVDPASTEKPTRIQALKQAFAGIAERYPDLKANRSFLDLQRQLSNTETRIALARGFFNEIATRYNIRLEVFPDRYIVRLGGMRPARLLQTADFENPPTSVFISAPHPSPSVRPPPPAPTAERPLARLPPLPASRSAPPASKPKVYAPPPLPAGNSAALKEPTAQPAPSAPTPETPKAYAPPPIPVAKAPAADRSAALAALPPVPVRAAAQTPPKPKPYTPPPVPVGNRSPGESPS